MSEGTQEQIVMPKHGEICWTEIGVKDLDKCGKFYREVFGWNIKASDANVMEGKYLQFDSGQGFDVGGIYELSKEMEEAGLPPHFVNYINVNDVEATAEKVLELGGQIVVEPQEIPNTGRMCVAQDSTGAMFALITLNEGGTK